MARGRGKRRNPKGKRVVVAAPKLPVGTVCEHPCPDCGSEMVLRNSQYGVFYGCRRYPNCKTAHGADDNTGKPLGIPADSETRAARIKAHDAFDRLWNRDTAPMTRTRAYKWLAKELGITGKECHIGMFDKATCERVVDLVRALWGSI